MRNRFFDPGFLFDFYSDQGSTAAPSSHSNVAWCGLGIFSGKNGVWRSAVLKFFFFKFDRPWNKNRKCGSLDFWNRRRMPDAVFKLIENAAYVAALCR